VGGCLRGMGLVLKHAVFGNMFLVYKFFFSFFSFLGFKHVVHIGGHIFYWTYIANN
jgi:hypothetical protein